MKCPKCGRVWADNVAFCPVDDAVLLASEPDALQPGGVAPTRAFNADDLPPTPDPAEELTQPAPQMVEPIGPLDEDDETLIRPRTPNFTAPIPDPHGRMNIPVGDRPLGTPPPQYAPVHPHPSAANSNPWKVAFLAMIGVLAIGGILFWLLRNNPNAQNSNVAPLTADPNGSPVLTASPPNGGDETVAPTVASPPPYTGDNTNTSANINTSVPPENSNLNANLPPINANVSTPTPTPRNANTNPGNANTGPPTPTPTPRTNPSATPNNKPPNPSSSPPE